MGREIKKIFANKPKSGKSSATVNNEEDVKKNMAKKVRADPALVDKKSTQTEAKLRKLKVDNEAVGKVTKLKDKLKSKTVGLKKAEMKNLITTDLIAAASEEQPRATKLKNKKKSKVNPESESVLGDPKIKAEPTSSVADILEESQKTHKVKKDKNKPKTDCESNDSNSSSAANVEGLPKNKPIEEEAKLRKLKVDNDAVGNITKSKNKLKSKTVGLEKAEMKDLMTSDLIAAASEEQPRATKLKIKKAKGKPNAESESVLGDPKNKANQTSSVADILEESQKTHKVDKAKNKTKTDCESNDSNSSSAANVDGLPKNKPLKDKLTKAKPRKLKVDNEAVGKVTKLKNKLKSKTVGLEKAEMKDLMTSDLIAAASEEQPRATKLKNKKKSKVNPESESVLGDPKIKAEPTSSVADILEESRKTHKVKKSKTNLIAESYLGDPKIETEAASPVEIPKLQAKKPKFMAGSDSNDSNFKAPSSAANMEGLPKKKPIEEEAKLRKLKFDNEAVGKVTKEKNKLKSKTVGLEKAEMKDLMTSDLIAAASEEQPRATKLKVKKANSKVNAESESILGDPKIKAKPTSVSNILEESQKTHKVKINTECESNDSNFSSAANVEELPKNKSLKDKLTEAKPRKLKVDNDAVGKVTKLKNKLKSKTVGLEKAEMKDLMTSDLIAAASEEQPRATKLKNKKKSKVNPESESVLGDPKNKANQTSSVSNILEESQKTHKVDKAKNKTKTDCESNDSNSSSAANVEELPKNKSLKDKLTEAKPRKLKVDNDAVGKVTKLKNKLKSKTVGLEKAEMKDLMTSDLIAAASEEQPRATKLKNKKKSKVNPESESVLGDPKNKSETTSSVADILEESQKTHKVKNAKNKPKTKCDANDSNSSSAANVEGLPKNPTLEDMTIKDQSASKASAEADIMEESLPKSEPRELRVAKKAKNKKKSSTASDVNKKIETGNKASPSTSNRPEGGLVTFCYSCTVCKSHLFRSRYILLSPDFIFD